MNSSNLKNSDIFIRYLSGETSPDEEIMVKQWIGESAENEAYFNQVADIWEDNASAEADDMDKQQLNKLFATIDTKTVEQSTTKIRTLVKYAMRIAAVLIIGFLGYWFITRNSTTEKTIASYNNKNCTVNLADNSRIYLNTKTTINYPDAFTGNAREITMQQGEAFFEITPNKEQPFYIYTPSATIKVIGTSFNVKIDSITNNVEVIVETGTVLLYDKNSNVDVLQDNNKLVVSECGNYATATKQVKKRINTNVNYLTWKTGIFIFDKTPLTAVFADLSMYYQVNFQVKDTAIYGYNLSARYSNRSIDEIIDMLKDTYPVNIEKEANQIRISIKNDLPVNE